MSDVILRTIFAWVGLLVLFRVSGRRTIGEMSPVDLIAMLIIGNVLQDALLDEDTSLTGSFTVVVTLLLLGACYIEVINRWPALARRLEGVPMILVCDGTPDSKRLRQARVSLDDVMEAARQQGVMEIGDIRFAILENNGAISIVEPGLFNALVLAG